VINNDKKRVQRKCSLHQLIAFCRYVRIYYSIMVSMYDRDLHVHVHGQTQIQAVIKSTVYWSVISRISLNTSIRHIKTLTPCCASRRNDRCQYSIRWHRNSERQM